MSAFLLGLLVWPALAFVGWLLLLAINAVRESWRRWRPTFIGDEEGRARHAASLAVARRVLVVRLPGARVLAWRSTIDPTYSGDPAAQAYAHIRDALDDAGRDRLVLRARGDR